MKAIPVRNLLPLSIVFASLCALTAAQEVRIVAPPGSADTEGDEFGFANSRSPTRVQYLYDASYFDAIQGPHNILSLAFRPNGGQSSFSSTIDDLQLWLSTTSVATLSSADLARNIGGDNRLVRSGPYTMTGQRGPGPKPFSSPLVFDTPFTYDPSQGNLLVDVVFGGSGFDRSWVIDNQTTPLINLVQGNIGARSGVGWNLVTPMEFTLVPVPEPAGSMIAIVLCLCALHTHRTSRHARHYAQINHRQPDSF